MSNSIFVVSYGNYTEDGSHPYWQVAFFRDEPAEALLRAKREAVANPDEVVYGVYGRQSGLYSTTDGSVIYQYEADTRFDWQEGKNYGDFPILGYHPEERVGGLIFCKENQPEYPGRDKLDADQTGDLYVMVSRSGNKVQAVIFLEKEKSLHAAEKLASSCDVLVFAVVERVEYTQLDQNPEDIRGKRLFFSQTEIMGLFERGHDSET